MMHTPPAVHDGSGPRNSHWTDTYDKWEGWKDPDEAIKKREEEEKRAKSFRENHMACAHDRSAERKVMEMPIEEKLEACRNFRWRGNLFHAEGQYRRGALQYRQALIYYDFCFPDEESQQQELDAIQQACLLNSAACFLACGELDETLDCCYQALKAEPDNVKALYRRAVVYRLRDQFKEASIDLGKALAQRPNEVVLRKESAVLKSKIASYRERRKAMGVNIFGRDQDPDHKGTDPKHDDKGPPLDASADPSVSSNVDDDHDSVGASDDTKDHTESFAKTARGTPSGDAYTVADRVAPGGSWRGDEEGRRRHDLTLPVCVDLTQLEAMARCAWGEEAGGAEGH